MSFGKLFGEMYCHLFPYQINYIFDYSFTGEILGKILIVVLRNNDFERGYTVFEKLNREQQKIVGVPSFDALSLFVDHCIKNKSPSKAIVSL